MQLGAGGSVGLYMQVACLTFRRGPKVYQMKLTSLHSFVYSNLTKFVFAFACDVYTCYFVVLFKRLPLQQSPSRKCKCQNDHISSISLV